MEANYKEEVVGIIGAGSFGTAVAQLIAENTEVLMFTRRQDIADQINTSHNHKGVALSTKIKATTSLEEVAQQCRLIFPIVPSDSFRAMMKDLAPFLKPYHILIHGTKGFDSELIQSDRSDTEREEISTMSEVIMQESDVLLVGCLSGPNLAREILNGQPAATVIASRFDKVINAGRQVLKSQKFQVFGTNDIIGAELAGALKNTVAIGSGILSGAGLGYNIWALFVTRGLQEMINFGKILGAEVTPFLGVAGIGDLIATASTPKSRNYTVGYRIAKGETLEEIIKTSEEVAEGIRTIQLIVKVANYYHISAPITRTIHRILFDNLEIERAVNYLINYPYTIDVDYL